MIVDYLKWEIKPIVYQIENGDNFADTGSYNNNTDQWSGLLGYLDRDEADTICLTYEYLRFRDIFFDYSYPIYNMRVVYISKHNTKNVFSALWNSFSPFPYSVWLIILAFLVIQATYATFVRYIEWKIGYERVFYPLEKYWQYLKFFLLQPEETKAFKSAAGVLVFAVFLVLQVLVFTNMYKVSVLSSLLKAPDLVPFHSSDEMTRLIANGQYKMITHRLNYEANWYFSDLRESDEPHFKNLRDALKTNPIFIVENASVALTYLQKGGYIYPSAQDSNLIQFLQGQCDLYYFSADTPQKSVYFIWKNASTILETFNLGLIMSIDYIGYTFSKYFENGIIGPPYPRCSDKVALPEAYKPLDFLSTFGVFFIISWLLGFSIVGLLFEKYIFWHMKTIREQRHILSSQNWKHSVFSQLGRFFGAHEAIRRGSVALKRGLSTFRILSPNTEAILLAGIPVDREKADEFVTHL